MDYKIIEIAKHLFTKYIDCEKFVMCGEHIVDKQPAISENSFKTLLKHLYSVCDGKPDNKSSAKSAIFDVVWRSEQLKAYAEYLQTRPDFQERSNKDLAIDYCDSI